MLIVTKAPQQDHSEKGESGGDPAFRSTAACPDFLVNEREKQRNNQSQEQEDEHYRLEDENNVPGVPFLGKWPERTDAVIVGEVEQDVADAGKACVEVKQSPARREIRVFELAPAQTPDQINEADHDGSVEWNSEEGMGEAAMVGEGEGSTAKAAED